MGGVGSQRHHSKLPELTSYLLCLCESTLSAPAAASPAGGAPPPQVRVSMVAVDAATASVVHDCFEVRASLSLPAQLARAKPLACKQEVTGVACLAAQDGVGRPALHTRLAQLQPKELLLPPEGVLSAPTERALAALEAAGCRLERREASEWPYPAAMTSVVDFYEGLPADAAQAEVADGATVLSLPEPLIVCLAVVLRYLEAFGLEAALAQPKRFRPFEPVPTSPLLSSSAGTRGG